MNRTLYWHYLFLTITLLLFDITLNALFEQHIFYSVLCAYIIQLYGPRKIAYLIMLIFGMSIESLLWYGAAWIPLIVIPLLTVLALVLQRNLYTYNYQPSLLLITSILSHTCFIEYGILGLPVSIYYTIIKISANIILLWCFSLK